MAIYNEILAARYARGLQKLFGMKGDAPTRQLSGEVMPILPFGAGVENRFIESWNRFGTTIALAAAAGFNGVGRLRNPAGSTMLAVIEKLVFTNSVPMQSRVEVRAVSTDLGTVTGMPNSRLDGRQQQTASAMTLSQQNTAAFSLTIVQYLGIVGSATGGTNEVILTDDHELVVAPGDALTLLEVNVNTTLNVTIFWRERFLEESERQ